MVKLGCEVLSLLLEATVYELECPVLFPVMQSPSPELLSTVEDPIECTEQKKILSAGD